MTAMMLSDVYVPREDGGRVAPARPAEPAARDDRRQPKVVKLRSAVYLASPRSED